MIPALARAGLPPGPPAGARILATPALLLVTLLGVVPLVILVGYSLLAADPPGGVLPRLSAEGWLGVILRRDIFDGSLRLATDHLWIYARSFAVAAVTTLLCAMIALPVAWHIATRPPAQRRWWLLAVTLPFWSSLLVRCLALLQILGDRGLINTALIASGLTDAPVPMLYTGTAVTLGMVYASLPFMILPVHAALSRLDPHLFEAAADLHATRFQRLRHVLIPAARPGLIAGTIITFVPALGTYVVPLVLGGGRSMMIGDLVAQQFGTARNWPLGAAESIVLMIAVLAALALLKRLEARA